MAQCGWAASSGRHDYVGGGGASSSSSAATDAAAALIQRLAADSAVVVFSVSSCCMCHVVKQLLGGLGVNLTVYEVDELVGGHEEAEAAVMGALAAMVGSSGGGATAGGGGGGAPPVPAVFIGGKLVGGLDNVMAAHISGALVPLLKQAGALWL